MRSSWARTAHAGTAEPLVSRQTAGEQEPSRLEVNLLFTTQRATLRALETVESLARDLVASIRLRATVVVPYVLALDEPPVSIPFLERSLFDLISRLEGDGFEATAHVYLCRDRDKALLQVLKPNALVVLGGRKRWWPTDVARLARALRAAGHRVVFVDSASKNEQSNLPHNPPLSAGTAAPDPVPHRGERK